MGVRYEYEEARAKSLELLGGEVNRLAAKRDEERIEEFKEGGFSIAADKCEYFKPHGGVFKDDGDYVQVMIREFWS